jgi:hypothetical protein
VPVPRIPFAPGTTKRAKAKDELWQVVKNVVAALERARNKVPGMRVTQRAQIATIHDRAETREVDVLVEIPSGGRTLSIGIEVKNKMRPIDLAGLGSIISLKEDLHLDRLCVVSTSGFAKRALRLAWRKGIELITMEQFEASEFWAAPPGMLFKNTQFQLLHVEFLYPESVLSEYKNSVLPILQAAGANVVLENSTGAASLERVIVGFAIDQKPSGLIDQQLLTINVELESAGVRLLVGGQEVPLPDRIVGVIRVHQKLIGLDETRFRVGDIEASTVAAKLGGEDRQLTIVAVPQEGGGKQLVLSVGPREPPKTRVDGGPLLK